MAKTYIESKSAGLADAKRSIAKLYIGGQHVPRDGGYSYVSVDAAQSKSFVIPQVRVKNPTTSVSHTSSPILGCRHSPCTANLNYEVNRVQAN